MTRRLRRGMRKAGIGALPILAGLLMASGLLRLGDGTGQAIAREIGQITAMDHSGAAAVCTPDEDVAAVLAALQDREDRLAAREDAIAKREMMLEQADARIREQMELLTSAEAELDEMLKLADTAADDDLARLTAVYENMKPKDAAALFEQMAPQFAAGFLGLMRPDAAASIMTGLKPETAYSVSVMLAGRHANLPRE